MTTETINKKRLHAISHPKRKHKVNIKKENRDIIFIVLTLYIIGLVFILSSSSASLVVNNQDPFVYVKKQLLFGAITLVPFSLAYFINIKHIVKSHKLLFYITMVMLALVMLIGKEVNGNKNWLTFGSFGIQPAEFAKISLIICSAVYFKDELVSSSIFKKVSTTSLIIICFVILQKDLGTAIIMCATTIFILFIGGLSYKTLSVLCLIGAGGITSAIIAAPYRVKRFLIFTNPFSDYYGYGYQIIQSLFSIANGGIFGRGLYESVQKYGYLPECHTDFIFAIIIEEIGFIGGIVVLSLFVLLITKIFKIAYSLKDRRLTIIVAGIGCLLSVEALLNLAVVVSLLPVTGVTLPFISYGGSSLMAKMTAIGLVLNINKNGEKISDTLLVQNSKMDAAHRKSQVKKVKQNVNGVKLNIYNNMTNFLISLKKIFKSSKSNSSIKRKKLKSTLELKSTSNNNNENLNNEVVYMQPTKKINTEKTPKFEIPNIKFDVRRLIDTATSSKTKVVNIDKTSGFKTIKIKKKNQLLISSKDYANKLLFKKNNNSELIKKIDNK